MRTLYDEEFADINISSEVVLAQFTVTGQNVALIAMVNVDGLSGIGGEYSAKLFIDDKLVVPDRRVFCTPGATSVSFQSRDLVVYENGLLTVKLQGLINDTSVSGRLILIDNSPVTVEEVRDLIMSIVPDINSEIVQNIDKINLTVKQETKVIGSCTKGISSTPGVIPQGVVKMPVVKKC